MYIYMAIYIYIYIYIYICKSANMAPDRQIGKCRPKAGNERFHKEKYSENDRFLNGGCPFQKFSPGGAKATTLAQCAKST